MVGLPYVERAKSKHSCRSCKSPIFKGEARLSIPVRKRVAVGVFWHVHRFCLNCAKRALDELSHLIRVSEEASLRDKIEEILASERWRYVGKEFVVEKQG